MIRLSRTAQRMNREEPVQNLRAKARAYIPRHLCLTVRGYHPPTGFEDGRSEAGQGDQQSLFRRGGQRVGAGGQPIHRPSTHKKARAAPRSQRKGRVAESVHGRRKEKENEATASLPQN
jgi:hypothetical protein